MQTRRTTYQSARLTAIKRLHPVQRAQRQLWLQGGARRTDAAHACYCRPSIGVDMALGRLRGVLFEVWVVRFPLMCTPKVSWLMYPHGSVCYVKSS